MRFEFMNGPWENADLPTIVRDNPTGGDPHILAVITRVHNSDALYELCRLANAAQDMTAAEFGAAITGSHEAAVGRAKQAASDAFDEDVAQMLMTFADEIEQDTGRAYAPAYMREAARRLRART